MSNSEDYLDSLLMAAQAQSGDNSAIEKIRKLGSELSEEPEKKTERKIEQEPEKEPDYIEEIVSTDSDATVDDLFANLAASEAALDTTPVTKESVEESPSFDKEAPSYEAFEAPEAIAEEAINADKHVEDLLKSDFSGEIEIPETVAEATSTEVLPQDVTSVDETPFEEPVAQELTADAEQEDFLNSLNESPFSNEKADNADNATNEPDKSLEEMAVELSDIEAMESEFGIFDKNDLSSLSDDELSSESDISALNEISGLLDELESNEIKPESEDLSQLLDNALIESEKEDAKKKEKKEKKEKKPKKEKKQKEKKQKPEESTDAPDAPKKKSFLARLLEFLTAEEGEEGEGETLLKPSDEIPAPDNGFEDVQGENKQILDEIDKEGEEKGKKKKKKKEKKPKKDKKASQEASDDEDGEGSSEGGKKKAKKEKKPLALDIDTGKPLSKRNVRLIAFLGATLLLLILLVCNIVPKVISHSQTRKAFYKGEYETVYNNFFGEKKLNESDTLLFKKSEIILKISHKYDAYKAYLNLRMPMEALDQLLQAVKNYELWLRTAEAVGADKEFKAEYEKILSALATDYDLSETAAREVNSLPTDVEYSLMVYSIVNKSEYIDPSAPLPKPFTPPSQNTDETPEYEDMLEEEGN